MRGAILNFASTRTIFKSGFKLIILDEADAMTNDAQNALRRGTYIYVPFQTEHTHTHSHKDSVCCMVSLCVFLVLRGAVIEKFTENVRFCMICNYLSKIIPALQSRCTRFRFGPLEPKQMEIRLQHVIQEEGWVCVYIIARMIFDCVCVVCGVFGVV